MATIYLPDKLHDRLVAEAKKLGRTPQLYLEEVLERTLVPANIRNGAKAERELAQLKELVQRIPAVSKVTASKPSEAFWWLQFSINIESPLAWRVVQELGYVLNYISLRERLPTVFKPLSPPPYLNGGPQEYLWWMIEATLPFVAASHIAQILAERLPSPVEDVAQWHLDEGDSD